MEKLVSKVVQQSMLFISKQNLESDKALRMLKIGIDAEDMRSCTDMVIRECFEPSQPLGIISGLDGHGQYLNFHSQQERKVQIKLIMPTPLHNLDFLSLKDELFLTFATGPLKTAPVCKANDQNYYRTECFLAGCPHSGSMSKGTVA